MSIEIHPKWYYDKMWFLSLRTGEGEQPIGDVLAVLYRDDTHWRLVTRLRKYDHEDPNNDPFSGQDDKTWWEEKWERLGEPEDTEFMTEARAIADRSFGVMAKHAHSKVETLDIQGDGTRAAYLLMQQDFTHMKVVDR